MRHNMDALATLLRRAHPVDREVLQLWVHPTLTEPARRALYGYRYWPRVHAAVQATTSPARRFNERVIAAADAATRTARVDANLLIGITAAAMELYDRIGPEMFISLSHEVALTSAALLETPTMVLRRRASHAPEGFLGRWGGDARTWRVTLEPEPSSHYTVRHGELLAACRGGNHEHCNVGVVAGADRLSPMTEGEPFPLIRRACETRVFGRVSLLAAL